MEMSVEAIESRQRAEREREQREGLFLQLSREKVTLELSIPRLESEVQQYQNDLTILREVSERIAGLSQGVMTIGRGRVTGVAGDMSVRTVVIVATSEGSEKVATKFEKAQTALKRAQDRLAEIDSKLGELAA